MTRKTRITILVLVVLIFVLVLVGLWMWLRPNNAVDVIVDNTPIEEPLIIDPGPTPQQEQLAQDQEVRQQASSVTTITKLFVERYGSYSNEAKFQNLIDLYPVMTSSFVAETQNFVATATLPDTYYGVSTHVLTVTVEEMEETATGGTATVRVQTQREIAEGSTQNGTVMYQEIRVNLERVEGQWVVSGAKWL